VGKGGQRGRGEEGGGEEGGGEERGGGGRGRREKRGGGGRGRREKRGGGGRRRGEGRSEALNYQDMLKTSEMNMTALPKPSSKCLLHHLQSSADPTQPQSSPSQSTANLQLGRRPLQQSPSFLLLPLVSFLFGCLVESYRGQEL